MRRIRLPVLLALALVVTAPQLPAFPGEAAATNGDRVQRPKKQPKDESDETRTDSKADADRTPRKSGDANSEETSEKKRPERETRDSRRRDNATKKLEGYRTARRHLLRSLRASQRKATKARAYRRVREKTRSRSIWRLRWMLDGLGEKR